MDNTQRVRYVKMSDELWFQIQKSAALELVSASELVRRGATMIIADQQARLAAGEVAPAMKQG